MIAVSFYHRDTGAFHPMQFGFTDPAAISLNTPPDHVAMEGHYDHHTVMVDTQSGEVVLRPDPQTPGIPRAAMEHAQRLREIALLEQSQPRAVRELLLGDEGARVRLQSIDKRIAQIRALL